MVEGKKLLYLESIRGLAALIVVAAHLCFAFRPGLFDSGSADVAAASWPVRMMVLTPLSFAYDGWFAVNLFFVLSGFVLSHSYFQTPRPQTLTGPALRRYFRLAIPSGISIFCACALMKMHLFYNLAVSPLTGSAWLNYLYNGKDFTPAFWGWHPGTAVYESVYGLFDGNSNRYNSVLWTMRIELIGSFLVYGILALFGSVRRRALIYALAAILLMAEDQPWLLGFVIGMAACDAVVARQKSGAPPVDLGRWGWAILLLGLMIGGDPGIRIPWTHHLIPGRAYHLQIGAALVIAAPMLSSAVRRPLEIKSLGLLGRISFGLYLVHLPVICSVGAWTFLKLVADRGWGNHSAFAFAAAVTVAISLLLGWAMFHVADRPSIYIGKRVSDWMVGKAVSRNETASRDR